MRLLSKRWVDAVELSEELFAMMNDMIPLEQRAPVTFFMGDNATQPAITVLNSGDIPSIAFRQKDGTLSGGINNKGDLVDPKGNPKQTETARPSPAADLSGIYAGTVVSGTGDTYTVQLFNDDGSSKGNFTVKQLKIDPAETIKPGERAIVGTRGTTFFMQVAVWGDPAP
jgi:hypothetical protein